MKKTRFWVAMALYGVLALAFLLLIGGVIGIGIGGSGLSAIARLVYAKSGINLHQGKRALVAARLQKRLRHGGFHTFRQYIRYLQSDDSGDELGQHRILRTSPLTEVPFACD